MRRRRWLTVLVLVALLVLAWSLRPIAPPPTQSPRQVAARPVALPTLPVTPPREAPRISAPKGDLDGVPEALRPVVRTIRCPVPSELARAPLVRIVALPWQHAAATSPVVAGAFEVPLPSSDIPRGGTLTTTLVVDLTGEGLGPGLDVRRETFAEGEPIPVAVEVPGFGRTTLVLQQDDGAWSCTVDAPEPYVVVRGVVRGADDDTVVEGCGVRVPVASDGRFELELGAGRCTLRATRWDGALAVTSDPVGVGGAPGDVVVVRLDLPSWYAGGVGVVATAEPDGMMLDSVADGTPAADAGLREGDLVVGVCGVDLAGTDPDDFHDLSIGAEGSEVTYTVVRDEGVVDVTMVREALDAER